MMQPSIDTSVQSQRGLKTFLLLASFLFLALQSFPLSASFPELYEEIRTHNLKLEKRLANWYERARLHADQMNT